jgi:hypothetical protein
MKLFCCYSPLLIRGKKEIWRGRVKRGRAEAEGKEKWMGAREELGRS